MNNNSTTNQNHYKTLLLDMDGVLADVSHSYRVAIEQTCHAYGATYVTQDLITEYKARGNANCDWTLSYNLIRTKNHKKNSSTNSNHSTEVVEVTFEQVKDTFERFYQGTDTTPGLYALETLIPSRDVLCALKQRSPRGVGIVTSRPKKDCLQFLTQHQLYDPSTSSSSSLSTSPSSFVTAYVTCEDGPNKPDPFPVLRCCALLPNHVVPSKDVVLVGDTPDDIHAAIAAGCSAVGVLTPEAYAEILQQRTLQQTQHEQKQQIEGGCDEATITNTNANTTTPLLEYPLTLQEIESNALAAAMLRAGADVILPPGFAGLVDLFHDPNPNNDCNDHTTTAATAAAANATSNPINAANVSSQCKRTN